MCIVLSISEIEGVIIYERREAEASKNHLKLQQLGKILQDISERVEGILFTQVYPSIECFLCIHRSCDGTENIQPRFI